MTLTNLAAILILVEHLLYVFYWIGVSLIDNHLRYIESPKSLWFQTQENQHEDIR